jgi:hypothetical protein
MRKTCPRTGGAWFTGSSAATLLDTSTAENLYHSGDNPHHDKFVIEYSSLLNERELPSIQQAQEMRQQVKGTNTSKGTRNGFVPSCLAVAI